MTTTTPQLAACPLPDWEVEEIVNTPLRVDLELVQPRPALLGEACGVPIDFDISAALSDPDGDDLHRFWFVNYTEGQTVFPAAAEVDEFRFDPCSPSALEADENVIEVFVMDRPPVAFTADGTRRVSGDGYLEQLYWVVPVGVRATCCPEAP